MPLSYFELAKVPAILVVGDREVANAGVSVRLKSPGDLGMMSPEAFLAKMVPEMEKGFPKYIG